jgi:hypothetical protein
MSSPEYSGTIEFPARFLDDEIKDCIVEHYPADIALGDLVGLGDVEAKITDGIFLFHDSEARYGEFEELEKLLIQKGVPFDRESGMDWNAPACIRIYRPGPPVFEHIDVNPDGYDQVVSVHMLRVFLDIDDAGEEAASAIRHYLDKKFPSYPPLADLVQEVAG